MTEQAKDPTVSNPVEAVVSRIDGYYICEVAYDFIRGVFWYDSKTDTFNSAGHASKSDNFTFISKEPIDLYDEKLWKMESC